MIVYMTDFVYMGLVMCVVSLALLLAFTDYRMVAWSQILLVAVLEGPFQQLHMDTSL